MMKPTLIILAAGMGSRYGGLKQVDGLGPYGETIIDYSVYDAIRAGFGKVIFVIRRSIEEDFMKIFGNRFSRDVNFDIVFQELDMLPDNITCPPGREKPWGTAHAVWVARKMVNEPFAVINADDFYGYDTFKTLANELSRSNLKNGQYFMVGFRLNNTLSEQGSVSRGACEVDNASFLKSIVEFTRIQRVDGKIFNIDDSGNRIELDGSMLVSMNFWGFTQDFFTLTETLLKEFLNGIPDHQKSEIYIPTVVNRAIQDGLATCKVLSTTSEWFGVTYPGDKIHVVDQLRKLTLNGVYPSPLW